MRLEKRKKRGTYRSKYSETCQSKDAMHAQKAGGSEVTRGGGEGGSRPGKIL